jgi:hypothetical protein
VHVLNAKKMVFHINVKYVELYSVNPVSNLHDVKRKYVVNQRQNQIKGDSQLSARSRSGSRFSTRPLRLGVGVG